VEARILLPTSCTCVYLEREIDTSYNVRNLIYFLGTHIKSLLYSRVGIKSFIRLHNATGGGRHDKGERLIGNRIEFTCGSP
jgi:hypothetical protein